jgi:hypothetical protein
MPSSKVESVKVALIKRAVGDDSSQEKTTTNIEVSTEMEVEIPLPPPPSPTHSHTKAFFQPGNTKGGEVSLYH